LSQPKDIKLNSSNSNVGETRPSASFAGTADQQNTRVARNVNSSDINLRFTKLSSNENISQVNASQMKQSIISCINLGFDQPPTKNINEIYSYNKIKNRHQGNFKNHRPLSSYLNSRDHSNRNSNFMNSVYAGGSEFTESVLAQPKIKTNAMSYFQRTKSAHH